MGRFYINKRRLSEEEYLKFLEYLEFLSQDWEVKKQMLSLVKDEFEKNAIENFFNEKTAKEIGEAIEELKGRKE